MAEEPKQSAFTRIGTRVSGRVADLAATPWAQVAVLLVCAAWWLVGFETDILTAVLSIAAITLTQMVLNNQQEREVDTHRRDVAMHAKLDELVIAARGARNEMVGIEELDEKDIEELKQEVTEAIDQAGEAAGTRRERAVAKAAAQEAVEEALEDALQEEAAKARAAKAAGKRKGRSAAS